LFENRVLRRIFESKRDEVTGEWRKLYNEKLLFFFYLSPNVIRQINSRKMRWAGHVARMREEREVYKVLAGKPRGKRPLGRPRRRLKFGIRKNLSKTGCGSVQWIHLAQVAGCCEYGDEPAGSAATELVCL
jgi:hypothetical protein